MSPAIRVIISLRCSADCRDSVALVTPLREGKMCTSETGTAKGHLQGLCSGMTAVLPVLQYQGLRRMEALLRTIIASYVAYIVSHSRCHLVVLYISHSSCPVNDDASPAAAFVQCVAIPMRQTYFFFTDPF